MSYYIVPLFYLLLNLIDAFTDYKLKDRVKHKRGAFIYTLISVVMFFVFGQWATTTTVDNLIYPLITRLAFFDPFYLLMIREKLSYEGAKDKKDKSVIDEIEEWTGIKIIYLRAIYLVIYIGYLIISINAR